MAVARVQSVLSEYQVLTELGRGAMGVVYLGQHKALGRKVAIKELLGHASTDDRVRSRFRTEAKVLASLDHPHVVPIYDFVERDEALLVVMEQLPGGTVWERFTQSGFTPPQAVAVVMATCAGLHHAHERDVVHRDIKPDNLMFADDGSVKVTDFGIAKVVAGAQTLATVDGGVLGTPAYMAPEQAMAADIGPAADVYATGVMLYELLSGRLPFPETDSAMAMLFQRVNEDPEPLWNHATHVPAHVAEATMKAIARDPGQRWGTPEEFGVAIGEASATSWGVDWLQASGLLVKGSERLSRAARTTRAELEQPVVDVLDTSTRSGASRASATLAEGAVDAGSVEAAAAMPVEQRDDPTVIPDSPATVIRDLAPDSAAPEARSATVIPPATVAPTTAPPTNSVTPATRTHLGGGIDLAALDPDDLVEIDEVIQKPGFPIVQIVAALAALAAMVWIALNPIGEANRVVDDEVAAAVFINAQPIDTEKSVELDLSQEVIIDVDQSSITTGQVAEAELGFSVVGVPVGKITENVVGGRAVIDPGPFEFALAGGLTGTVTLRDSASNDLGASDFKVWIEKGWLTVTALIGVLLAFGVFAYFESNARPLRKGRRKISRLIGLGLTGAVAGVTAVVAVSVIKLFEPRIPTLVATALLGAIGFTAIGLALVRLGRRRRLRTRRV